MKRRDIIPEQEKAKAFMRRWLEVQPEKMLVDISRETGIPLTNLYYWVNGKTLNFKTPAYVQAVNKWMARHKNDIRVSP
jgi:predicted transcriptional regulator